MQQSAWLGAFLVLVLSVPALAQVPLAEVARKEAERRKAVDQPSKVYTNEDIKQSTKPLTVSARSASGGAEAPEAEAEAGTTPADAAERKPAEDQPGQNEAYWRGRMQQARDELSRAQMFSEALQSRINGLWADFTARDDPAQRSLLAQERQKALDEQSRVQGEVTKLTQQLSDLEEEARRAGVPPGWLR